MVSTPVVVHVVPQFEKTSSNTNHP